jgi:hypothetical protein
MGCSIRLCVVGIVLLAVPGAVLGDQPAEPLSDRVARLIKQLGHDRFAKREAASKELDVIGEPALDALRMAAASNADPEVRRRAETALRMISARVGVKMLAKWEGTWMTGDRVYLKLSGARFSSGTPTYGPASGTIMIVDVGDKVTSADLVNEDGPLKGGIALAIFRRDGDTLHACWSYTGTRPTEFKNEGNNYCFAFKRVQK